MEEKSPANPRDIAYICKSKLGMDEVFASPLRIMERRYQAAAQVKKVQASLYPAMAEYSTKYSSFNARYTDAFLNECWG